MITRTSTPIYRSGTVKIYGWHTPDGRMFTTREKAAQHMALMLVKQSAYLYGTFFASK